MVHPTRLPPITHCSSPDKGRPGTRMPGTAHPEEPGAQRPRPRRLTFLMLAPGPSHMDFYNLTSPGPGRPREGRSRRQSRARACRIGRRKEERGGERSQRRRKRRRSQGGPGAGAEAGPTAEGGGTRRSPETRSRGRLSQTCAPPRPQPRRSARYLARSRSPRPDTFPAFPRSR